MVENLEKGLRTFNSNKTKSSNKLQRSELSLDINEILEIDLEESSVRCKDTRKCVEGKKVKCCPILIGCVDFNKDSKRSIYPRVCSALHCRNCDFSVSSFPNYEWSGDVDYLFLRTNMPNFEKVSEKLIKKNASIAYACHCVSFSTDTLMNIHEGDLPWFCRGHI